MRADNLRYQQGRRIAIVPGGPPLQCIRKIGKWGRENGSDQSVPSSALSWKAVLVGDYLLREGKVAFSIVDADV